MGHGKSITEFEREIIRIGISGGCNGAQIARYLGRNKQAVYNHIEGMKRDGTINNLPFALVATEILEAINAKG